MKSNNLFYNIDGTEADVDDHTNNDHCVMQGHTKRPSRVSDDILIDNPSKDICIDTLIDHVFPNLHVNCTSEPYMHERAILSTRNEHVDAVNALMINRFPGSKQVYYSFDSVEDDPRNNYPLGFLNSITPNGLPPHELTIKKNCPIILLRNLDPHNGLCNGIRLIGQTIPNIGIYLPEPIFSHRQLYMALFRGVSRIKNIVYRDVLES
ncbi:hypothetical protein SETIT_7G146300v2 [Setaria italica]|uniref:DNA helicase Pif1-like 2B domain-containing protein n=1 Tax=Setaria italica TaxID=4555 RepID=K3YDZ6_SETIT|nr:hypothetical protein SETIT_7G146300v2 [Setaria italica]